MTWFQVGQFRTSLLLGLFGLMAAAHQTAHAESLTIQTATYWPRKDFSTPH